MLIMKMGYNWRSQRGGVYCVCVEIKQMLVFRNFRGGEFYSFSSALYADQELNCRCATCG